MNRTGHAVLPLHPGRCPRWLFRRMVLLSKEIGGALVLEFGTAEFLRRISDPFWFQALSCVLGFDWHSSGTTTTACGALKLALSPEEHGIAVAGGKGRASRRAPVEIGNLADVFSLNSKAGGLVRASRMSAKVDNSCVQDGYQLYHHSFFLSEKGEWAVVQQGMHGEQCHGGGRFGCNGSYARRYHWASDGLAGFVEEPHSGICCSRKEDSVLDMTAKENGKIRRTSVDIVNDNPEHLKKYFSRGQSTLLNYDELVLPGHHEVLGVDLGKGGMEVLEHAYEIQPENYEELVSLRGMGPKKIRALALLSGLIYGEKLSWKDPAKFSFAHGGKDGFPYPVDRKTYDNSIEVLKSAVENARIERKDKLEAIKRLSRFLS